MALESFFCKVSAEAAQKRYNHFLSVVKQQGKPENLVVPTHPLLIELQSMGIMLGINRHSSGQAKTEIVVQRSDKTNTYPLADAQKMPKFDFALATAIARTEKSAQALQTPDEKSARATLACIISAEQVMNYINK